MRPTIPPTPPGYFLSAYSFSPTCDGSTGVLSSQSLMVNGDAVGACIIVHNSNGTDFSYRYEIETSGYLILEYKYLYMNNTECYGSTFTKTNAGTGFSLCTEVSYGVYSYSYVSDSIAPWNELATSVQNGVVQLSYDSYDACIHSDTDTNDTITNVTISNFEWIAADKCLGNTIYKCLPGTDVSNIGHYNIEMTEYDYSNCEGTYNAVELNATVCIDTNVTNDDSEYAYSYSYGYSYASNDDGGDTSSEVYISDTTMFCSMGSSHGSGGSPPDVVDTPGFIGGMSAAGLVGTVLVVGLILWYRRYGLHDKLGTSDVPGDGLGSGEGSIELSDSVERGERNNNGNNNTNTTSGTITTTTNNATNAPITPSLPGINQEEHTVSLSLRDYQNLIARANGVTSHTVTHGNENNNTNNNYTNNNNTPSNSNSNSIHSATSFNPLIVSSDIDIDTNTQHVTI